MRIGSIRELKIIKTTNWSADKKIHFLIWIGCWCLPGGNGGVDAQEPVPPPEIFYSTQSANLPTAKMLERGQGILEISHRFLPPISDGAGVLWGLDGPAYNRLGLGFAVDDNILLGVLRSSLEDNLEVNAKIGLGQKDGGRPWMVAAVLGSSWDFDNHSRGVATVAHAYLQFLFNTLLTDRIAIGVVPSLFGGFSEGSGQKPWGSAEMDFAVGFNGQFYMNRRINLIAEWIATQSRTIAPRDVGSLGIEFRTRGHFFKILLSNQVRMNPSQYLMGSPFGLHPNEWRLGFNVVRILDF